MFFQKFVYLLYLKNYIFYTNLLISSIISFHVEFDYVINTPYHPFSSICLWYIYIRCFFHLQNIYVIIIILYLIIYYIYSYTRQIIMLYIYYIYIYYDNLLFDKIKIDE